MISKRLRSLGLNETKTYTLTSPDMASKFKYEEKENNNQQARWHDPCQHHNKSNR